ncbi:hypothetical protein J0S82_014945 [Galemys pyrenaicus]|uniref:Uncharacterized protein n=1 Tax=Galemys pyrenaicus TaxID=202257 RepID=A0A8J6ACA2_GALPY|nr:hypothetical protein J0S82_014945 [Galemys pyrenaicus]
MHVLAAALERINSGAERHSLGSCSALIPSHRLPSRCDDDAWDGALSAHAVLKRQRQKARQIKKQQLQTTLKLWFWPQRLCRVGPCLLFRPEQEMGDVLFWGREEKELAQSGVSTPNPLDLQPGLRRSGPRQVLKLSEHFYPGHENDTYSVEVVSRAYGSSTVRRPLVANLHYEQKNGGPEKTQERMNSGAERHSLGSCSALIPSHRLPSRCDDDAWLLQ